MQAWLRDGTNESVYQSSGPTLMIISFGSLNITRTVSQPQHLIWKLRGWTNSKFTSSLGSLFSTSSLLYCPVFCYCFHLSLSITNLLLFSLPYFLIQQLLSPLCYLNMFRVKCDFICWTEIGTCHMYDRASYLISTAWSLNL